MAQSQMMTSVGCFVSVVLLLATMQSEAQLSPTFYDNTCPNALASIQNSIRLAVSSERRMAASLIRLHFHDCFVQGCDASVLLEDSVTLQSERNAVVNNNSIRGFEVIEAAKAQVESICPGVVSCADILALAARDASTLVGGPTWEVKLGRRDSTTANLSQANSDLPRFNDIFDILIEKFDRKGFSAREMVTLSGAHSIGQARCITFRERIYNETNIDADFASTRRLNCPQDAPNGDSNLAPIDFTPNNFDNNYYTALTENKGLFSSDQILFNGGSTDNIVLDYSNNPQTFSADFAAVMIRMSDREPLTGQDGIIRNICSAPAPAPAPATNLRLKVQDHDEGEELLYTIVSSI